MTDFKNPYRHGPQFSPKDALYLVDTEEDASAARERLEIEAVTRADFDRLSEDGPLERSIIVIGNNGAVAQAKGIIEFGYPTTLVRAVDLSPLQGQTVSTLTQENIDYLQSLVVNAVDPIIWDKVRPVTEWGEREPPELLPCGHSSLEDSLRWRMPNVSVWVGGYGSGKSTIACLMAMKAMLTPEARAINLKASFCCFEDDLDDFRFRTQAQAIATAGDERAVLDLQSRSWWFDENLRRPRGLNDYLDTICRLTVVHGVRWHVFDPWTAHIPEFEQGENEQRYIQARLNDIQQLSKELKVAIHIICHTTKAGNQNPDSRVKIVRVNDAHGSGDFGKFADYGFGVARTSWMARLMNGHREEGFDDIAIGEARAAVGDKSLDMSTPERICSGLPE